ncbi:MAG: DUF2259 domain-containing protein [Leptolyngbyaceae cyanobacterium RU_5_1]|nr:DUF2259 domain-containing protein [Leptolyngbyaceae cyanobacterium RU_5_1]
MGQVSGTVGRWVLSGLVVALIGACSESASSRSSSANHQSNQANSSASIAVDTSNSLNPPTPTFKAAQQAAGFSPDGKYYIYLESSQDTGAGIPKVNLQVVDVSANACVRNGCIETRYGEAESKLSIKDAEQDLLQQTWTLRQKLQLTSPTTGVKLPIRSRSRTADGTETITVQLDGRQSLQLRLQQKRTTSAIAGGTAEKDQAALRLEVFDGREPRSLGSLKNFRDWVLDYSIREVYLAPNSDRVVVLVTATKPTFEGTIGTTLVQSFEL